METVSATLDVGDSWDGVTKILFRIITDALIFDTHSDNPDICSQRWIIVQGGPSLSVKYVFRPDGLHKKMVY